MTIHLSRLRTRVARWLGGLLLPLVAGCSVASRLDYGHLWTRQGWQRPERVLEVLAIPTGAHVADLGAGDGYFTWKLAEAVGPHGRIFAIEIDPDRIADLRRGVADRQLENVIIVEGTASDARLPDGTVDLVFLCNAYHHFEERVAYFERLRRDLAPGARLAIIDGKSSGAATWLLPEGHWLAPGQLRRELDAAGYVHLASHDFLPLQDFDLFIVPPEGEAVGGGAPQ